MTVRELMAALAQFDPDLEVLADTDEAGLMPVKKATVERLHRYVYDADGGNERMVHFQGVFLEAGSSEEQAARFDA